jgi:hypothetical protein
MKNIALLWAILAVSIGLAQDKPSLAGNWKLDIVQSEFGSGPAPKSVAGTIFKESPQMFSYRSHGIYDKGKPFSESWSGPEDGSMHPVILGRCGGRCGTDETTPMNRNNGPNGGYFVRIVLFWAFSGTG